MECGKVDHNVIGLEAKCSLRFLILGQGCEPRKFHRSFDQCEGLLGDVIILDQGCGPCTFHRSFNQCEGLLGDVLCLEGYGPCRIHLSSYQCEGPLGDDVFCPVDLVYNHYQSVVNVSFPFLLYLCLVFLALCHNLLHSRLRILSHLLKVYRVCGCVGVSVNVYPSYYQVFTLLDVNPSCFSFGCGHLYP